MNIDSMLKAWGTPRYLFGHKPLSDVEELSGRFSVHENKVVWSSSMEKQKKMLADLTKTPFRKGSVFCFCSENDDLIAKLAALMFLRGVAESGVTSGCKWHVVYGGIGRDDYLEASRKNDDLLPRDKLVVFSNVYPHSTALKKERLGDLLEANGDVSTVLATTGENPVELLRGIGRHATGFMWFPAKTVRKVIQ